MAWRIAFTLAFVLAIGGGVLYLIADTDAAWWIGVLMGVPLLVLVGIRAARLGDRGDASAAFPDGPWGPP
jgi:hypothetical protein